MLEREFGQTYPASREIANLSSFLTITREDVQDEAVEALLEAMRYVFANGGAQFASFLVGPSSVLDYFAPRDELDDIGLWSLMLQAPVVAEALPWLGETYFSMSNREISFQPLNAFYLDRDLAQTLMKGGAYRRFPGTAEEAKQLGLDFCSAVFENRYDEVIVRKSKEAWARWFMYGPWDCTWLGIDRRTRRFWILCGTDTD